MPTPSADIAPLDLQACKYLLRRGSKSFSLASLLLPRRVRDPASAIYAFCRIADDIVDEGEEGPRALDVLHERLRRAYDAAPIDHPVDRAFSSVVRAYDIPIDVPAALLEGFAWDAQGRQYDTIEEAQAYGARVAGTVGVMMTLLMGRRDETTLERACDLGVAMQLTNIARDVGEDARNGRIYLPGAWLREAGVEPSSMLRDPAFRPEIGVVVERLLQRAEVLYMRSDAGIGRLPPDCQPSIRAARLFYSEIGNELSRRGLDSINQRTVVGLGTKLRLLLRAFFGRAPGESAHLLTDTSYEPLPETAFLVRASAQPERLIPQEATS